MKFVDMEEIWKKYPNKYVAIVAAAKEARKIIETRKPPSPPRSVDAPITAETAVPEPAPIEPPAPKKRGRKPKKPCVAKNTTEAQSHRENIEENSVSSVTPCLGGESFEMRGATQPLRARARWHGVAREKTEVNVYIEALKKVLK